MAYAAGTAVNVEKSKMELDRLLVKHGATSRATGTDSDQGFAWCAFTIGKRNVRLTVPIPSLLECRPKAGSPQAQSSSWRRARGATAEGVWCKERQTQIERERWRGLLLIVKAKLEIIELGLSTVEREFLSDIFLPNGRTVHEMLREKLEQAYLNGSVPPLMLGPVAAEGGP